jgi:hypothetical protein
MDIVVQKKLDIFGREYKDVGLSDEVTGCFGGF